MVGNLKNGIPMATPVFDGANGDDINRMLKMAGLPTSGQIDLYDGRTGEKFDRKVTVGIIYMIKLHHIVDEKCTHVRSARTASLLSSRWAVRRNSAANVSEKWKFGRCRHTARLTRCRKC